MAHKNNKIRACDKSPDLLLCIFKGIVVFDLFLLYIGEYILTSPDGTSVYLNTVFVIHDPYTPAVYGESHEFDLIRKGDVKALANGIIVKRLHTDADACLGDISDRTVVPSSVAFDLNRSGQT